MRKHFLLLGIVVLFGLLFLIPKHKTIFYYNSEIKKYVIPWYNNTFIYTFNNPKKILLKFKDNLTNFNYAYLYNYSTIYFIYNPYLKGNFSLGVISLLNHIILPLRNLGFEVVYVCTKPYNSTYCQIIGNESLCSRTVFCIIYREGKENVSLIKNKLYIIGNESNILKLVDLVVLRFYGVRIN